LAGALYELNHQPTSLIKKNSLLQKLHPNLWKELINEYALKYSIDLNYWLNIISE
jgi:hypothetical protein